MVSKTKITIITTTTKRTPTKRTPTKSSSPSLRRSLRSCRRRLFSILSLLSSRHHRLGFRRLNPIIQQTQEPVGPTPLPFPSPNKPTLFLDLDETLIHSHPHSPPPFPYDFTVHPVIENRAVPFFVAKRPGVDLFLSAAAEAFEVVVFTAGMREYASLVLDRLDPEGTVFSHRLYRDSCREVAGGRQLVKDLSGWGRDLGRVVIFDDNPSCYSLQKENAVPVRPFVGEVVGDREMERLMGFFQKSLGFDDMRDAVRCFLEEEK